MKLYRHIQNNWFQAGSLQRFFYHLTQACVEHTAWLRTGIHCKYIFVRFDMRTGDFCIFDSNSQVMSDADMLKLFLGMEILPYDFHAEMKKKVDAAIKRDDDSIWGNGLDSKGKL